ncbi:hypothetical protein [Streptomyces sp. SAI-127]|uniref:hypothetical protein n=1 Tax=Streptomyces sp. SAI-127 TaxID=2940543 RepID=UPI002474F08F|nr:hypothetical protein [Streptomyces sp. SAI-127]MDH6484440.1 hypothetical protein [Streptomyces sp. SAI-127]
MIAALILANEDLARQLAPLLGELDATACSQVEMHHRVEASRARTHTTVPVPVITTLTFASALILFTPPTSPPATPLPGN